jgi:hypothetical protein
MPYIILARRAFLFRRRGAKPPFERTSKQMNSLAKSKSNTNETFNSLNLNYIYPKSSVNANNSLQRQGFRPLTTDGAKASFVNFQKNAVTWGIAGLIVVKRLVQNAI